MERIKIGVSGLDRMLGGFPAGRTILVTGDAGAGKTILALQFANTCCSQNLKTVYISSEEEAGDLIAQGESFGWDLESSEAAGLLRFIELAGLRAAKMEMAMNLGLEGLKKDFAEILTGVPADTNVIIIDSLGSHAARLNADDFRELFDHLVYKLRKKGVTTLIILDSATSKNFNDLALFSAYGAIRLMKRENPFTGNRERAMDIVKMRNTSTPIQFLTYEISPAGIVITSVVGSEESA